MTSGPERERRLDQPVVFHSLAEMPPMPVSLGTTLTNRTGTWRYIRPYYQDKTPPCNHACPAGSDIVHWLAALAEGDDEAAWRLLVTENPLPGVCGRVCPHPCEVECNRSEFGGAIAIHALERYLADEAAARGWRVTPAGAQRQERVAIVGAGPAGLSCAYHLARLGYAPTVYEAQGEPGGLLRYGIPPYRLPRDVLDHEVASIEAVGVRLVANTRLGGDLPLSDLQEMDAIFLAVGQGRSRPLGVAGEEAASVLAGLEFLRRLARGDKVDLGRRVTVVGGGNTAVDAARSALRLGADVTVLYRRTERQMPAIAEEVDEARAEGIGFRFLAAPKAVLVKGGQVHALRCIEMRLGEPDASGRERPLPVAGSEFDLPADTIITATGQELDARLLAGSDLRLEAGLIAIDQSSATTVARVFAGGDAATGEGTVAQAIGSGKRGALAIDRYLRTGRVDGFPPMTTALHVSERKASPVVVEVADLNASYVEVSPRLELPQRPAAERRQDFSQVNLGPEREEALQEAARCISCGTCTACDTCLIFCPDVAIARGEPGSYTIAYDYCKGCGICARECPRSALAMEEEGQ